MTRPTWRQRPLRRGIALGALGALAGIAPTASVAEERPLWELGMGLGTLRLPHYRGSDQRHDWLLPAPLLVYRGEIFKSDREGARAVLLDTEQLDLDLSLGASAPTRSRDNDARRGMDDLAPTLEIGPNANLTLARGAGWKLQLRMPLRAAFTLESRPRAIGWIATPNLNLDVTRLGGWNLGLLAGPVYGSRRLHGYFYDVRSDEATAERSAYRAAGGAAGAQAIVALSRRFERTWVGGFAKFDSLHGAHFAASPLVRERSQWSMGVAVSWVFATSDQQVTVPQ